MLKRMLLKIVDHHKVERFALGGVITSHAAHAIMLAHGVNSFESGAAFASVVMVVLLHIVELV